MPGGSQIACYWTHGRTYVTIRGTLATGKFFKIGVIYRSF
ncbi:unnamed protein product [Arabidopsis halleri]